ncbi:MAG: fumarylacetoacetate hydrolase family protein [Planctomycetota bacterium]
MERYEIYKRDGRAFVGSPGGELELSYIVGIGRNYAKHAAERGADVPERPMVFVKGPRSVILDGDAIEIPACCADASTGGPAQVDYEAELAVVLGRDTKDASESEALGCVLGYCCANDVSARWWQKHGSGGQFNRGKSFDTFCPLGPAVVPAGAAPDPDSLEVICRLNGETMQHGSTGDMVFSVRTLVSELSRGQTLPAGTVILTGTPEGVGAARTPPVFLKDGDEVEVEIPGVGLLRNPVVGVG